MKAIPIIAIFSFCAFYALDVKSQNANLNFSAYLDLYYTYDFFDPAGKQRQFVTQAARHNEFNLNLGFVQADYSSDHVRGNLTLQVGNYPTANYGAEPVAFAQLIQNASVGIRLGEQTWVDAGVMGGHFGYESVRSMDNELYTQALATEYTPYYQTGVQLSSDLSDRVSFRAVVVNGWQNIFETNDSKSVGIAADYSIDDNWGISYGNYLGEDPVAGEDRLRFHQNFYLNYTGSAYSSALIIDYMLEGLNVDLAENTNLVFITWIHQLILNENWKLAARYEYVEDPTNVLFASPTGAFQSNIATVALRRKITDLALFSLEYRQFFGEEDIWLSSEGETGASNTTLTAGLSIKFD